MCGHPSAYARERERELGDKHPNTQTYVLGASVFLKLRKGQVLRPSRIMFKLLRNAGLVLRMWEIEWYVVQPTNVY